jgi:hypothetical protein
MQADLAMYEAKQAGGSGWRIFGDAARSERANGGRATGTPGTTRTNQR